MKKKPTTHKVHLVTKRSAWRAACGQDAPRRETKDRAKVTCGGCLASRTFRGKPS